MNLIKIFRKVKKQEKVLPEEMREIEDVIKHSSLRLSYFLTDIKLSIITEDKQKTLGKLKVANTSKSTDLFIRTIVDELKTVYENKIIEDIERMKAFSDDSDARAHCQGLLAAIRLMNGEIG